MLRVGVGHSDDIDVVDAIREALAQCEQQLAGARPKVALVFAGSELEHQVILDEVHTRHPGLPLIGGTSVGELSSLSPHRDDSVVLVMLASDVMEFGVGLGRGATRAPGEAARAAVEMARRGMTTEPRLCIAVPEAVQANPSEQIEGLKAALGADFPVFGGAAATTLARTTPARHFFGDEVLEDALTVLLVGGEVRFSHGMACGWTPIGARHKLTRAEGNVVFEIDGQPASELYTSYVGRAGDELGVLFNYHPLAIFEDGADRFYLRAPFARGEVPGSIICAGAVPQGATVQLTEYQRSTVVEAAADSARQAVSAYGPGTPSFALIFNCALRKSTLGSWTEKEYQTLRAELPPDVPMLGYYSYGECAPLGAGSEVRIYNGTFVTLLLGSP
ncbi:MAG: FIST N-terminal domain-containing protein [Myxococcota bacterium]